MTSFKWKRKAGENISKETVKKFCSNAADDSVDINDHIPSLPTIIALEDRIAKKNRLYQEGCVLATDQRYWEAFSKWSEAIQLCPNDEKLYEMQSQVLMELQEIQPAIQAAEQAVRLSPVWWVAYQTLGRAQLSAGEVQMAIRSFSKACHLNPSEQELWEEDLKWARSLAQKSKEISNKESCQNYQGSVSIQELDSQTEKPGDQEEVEGVSKALTRLNRMHPDPIDGTIETASLNMTLTKLKWIKMRKTD